MKQMLQLIEKTNLNEEIAQYLLTKNILSIINCHFEQTKLENL